MGLLDHFHPPLSARRHWEGFHALWASLLSISLNEILPPDYYAEPQVHGEPRIEVDVATFENPVDSDEPEETGGGGGTAVLTAATKKIVRADLTLPLFFPPTYAINVIETTRSPRLVAAIELVSPGNKDRPEARTAFTAKCHGYLQRGQGLIVVDIVTSRTFRPFEDLYRQLTPEGLPPDLGDLTAAGWRPLRIGDDVHVEVRHKALTLGGELPVLPLSLDAFLFVDVEFGRTYEDAVKRSRIG